jgi:hypothetical protein
MADSLEDRVAALEATIAEAEPRLARIETIVTEGTPAGQYTAVVEKLMLDNGWTAEEATRNFNALLNSLPTHEVVTPGDES